MRLDNGVSYEFKILKTVDTQRESLTFNMIVNKMVFRRNQIGMPSINGEFTFVDEELTSELMAYYFDEAISFLDNAFKKLLQKGK